MASSKGTGKSYNGRTSNPQYRCLKKSGGQSVIPGNIIVTQLGNKYHAGKNVGIGKNFTIYAKNEGVVYFRKGFKKRTYIDVIDLEEFNKKTCSVSCNG